MKGKKTDIVKYQPENDNYCIESKNLLAYVDAANVATARARAVIIVLIVSSGLAFISLWNSGYSGALGQSWLDSRIKRLRKSLDSIELSVNENVLTHDNYKLNTEKQLLYDQIQNLNKIRIEHYLTLSVPFFGSVIDSNDIGVFAGISFTIILLWLRYSLLREYISLELTIIEAHRCNEIKLAYDLLAMQQVFTVPRTLHRKNHFLWSNLPKLIYLIPGLILFELFRIDNMSVDVGMKTSIQNTITVLELSGMFLILVIVLVVMCISRSRKIDKKWNEFAQMAYPV